MLIIKKDKITHMRGDTGCITVNLYADGEPYTMRDGDKLIFSVKRAIGDTEYVLQKESKTNQIFFVHKDTNNLAPGTYVYDIQLVTSIGMVQTMGPGKYILQADITRE